MVEHVVLVDENNAVLGTAPKADVHTENTPLHRAFSVFLFNERGELLLQQRAHSKKTWPGVWSNSCCGHPQLNEETVDAASRRIREELGLFIPAHDLICMLPNFRYQATFQGVQENELCPVFVGRFTGDIAPNPDEVETTKRIPWNEFLNTISSHPETYSVWCEQEAHLLAELKAFREWLQ